MPSSSKDRGFWDEVRSGYALYPGATHLDNSSFAPSPLRVVESVERWYHQIAANPSFPMRFTELEGVRKVIAHYLHAAPEEIAITRSATDGLHLVLQGIQWRQEDEVLSLFDQTSVVGISLEGLQLRYGIVVNHLNIDWLTRSDEELVAQLSGQLTNRTRLLVIPHVEISTGRLLPVKAISDIARENGVLTLLDASQSVGSGVVNFDRLGADYIVAPGHAWLSAGVGTGIAYFRKESQDYIWQTAGSFYDPGKSPASERAAIRFERNAGQKNIPCLMTLTEAIAYQRSLGLDVIGERIGELTSILKESIAEVKALNVVRHGGVSSNNLLVIDAGERDATTLQDFLFSRHSIKVGLVNSAGRTYLSISPHVHNSEKDLVRLVDALSYETAH